MHDPFLIDWTNYSHYNYNEKIILSSNLKNWLPFIKSHPLTNQITQLIQNASLVIDGAQQ